MLPYSRGLILDNTSNYGIVKTETVFGFGSPNHNNYVNNNFNATEPLEWIFTQGKFEKRSLQDTDETDYSRSLKVTKKALSKTQPKQKSSQEAKQVKKVKRAPKRSAKKVNKCILKILKKGEGGGGGSQGGEELSHLHRHKKIRRRGGYKYKKMHKKYMMPVILGLLAAKSVLIPIALKALAFLSAKGLMMGFFSTVMASVLSLKGMFDHNHGSYQNRKDDTKTQVEIIQVPTKSEDHVYYDDYRRGDLVPDFYKTKRK